MRETLNPYRRAASLLVGRLRWDLTPTAWASRRRLRDSRDRHRGDSAVIVCNGPSLLRADLSLLAGHYTFGLNKINLLFERSTFRPSCIVAVNPLVIDQNSEFYRQTECPLFLDSRALARVGARNNIVYIHSAHMDDFARDCSISIVEGHTVTYVALQLAFHLGFARVALIGADHTFARRGEPNSMAVAEGDDPDHFDPRYFSNGAHWHLPDLAASERFYLKAREVYEQAGRRIVNATAGGKLEVFERQPLERFLRG